MYAATALLSLLLYVAVVWAFVRSRYFSAFHPFTLYAMFHGLVFVLRPLLSLFIEYTYVYRAYHFTPTDADRVTALLAANLGFLAFAFFAFRPSSGAVEMRFARDPLLEDERNRLARYFVWAMAICTPLALWSLLSHFGAMMSNEVFAQMEFDRATGIAINTSGNGYFYEAQLMMLPLTTIVAWVFRFRLLALVPTILFVLIRASIGGRGPFVSAMFALGLFYLYHQRRKFPTLRITGALAAVGLLFVAVGQDRGNALRVMLGGEATTQYQSGNSEPFLGGMDFANMEYLEYVIYVVPQRSQTYTYFTENLQLFTEPIPRALWPGKPVGAPIQRFSMFDYGFPIGATWSLPGVGWMALGWLGVIIQCGVWGWSLGWLYRKFVESDQSTFKVAAYMCFIPILVVAYRDGLVVTLFRQGIFYLFPVVLWVLLARAFNVPLARDIRGALIRRRRHAAANAPAGEATGAASGATAPPGAAEPAASLAGLPPAVRRRRLALAARTPA